MNKARILFISHSSELYGAEKCLLSVLSYLRKDKYDALALFPYNGPLTKRVEEIGWDTMILKMPWWLARERRSRRHFRALVGGMRKRVKILCKLIKDRKIDVVYSNTVTIIDGAIASRLTGIPHIWHIHEILSKTKSLKSYIPNPFIRFTVNMLADRIIVPSNATRREIQTKSNHHKIRVVNNGFELKRFSSGGLSTFQGNLQDELAIPKGTKVVGLVGYFQEIKGQADFIEAAKIVSKDIRNTAFILVGNDEGAYGELMKEKVKELKLENKVYFLGHREDIEKIMSCVDILVSASWVESFPGVLCEAMAAGKPVIATRCGGSEEIVVDGITGLLVPVRDPIKMADAIIKILSEKEGAKEMGRRGRQRVEELFSVENYVNNIENVLKEVCPLRN